VNKVWLTKHSDSPDVLVSFKANKVNSHSGLLYAHFLSLGGST